LEQETFNRNSNRIHDDRRPVNDNYRNDRDENTQGIATHRRNHRGNYEKFSNENSQTFSDDEKIIRRKNFADNKTFRRKVEFSPEPADSNHQSDLSKSGDLNQINSSFRNNSEERKSERIPMAPQDPYFSSLE
jgi:hypothetical protein